MQLNNRYTSLKSKPLLTSCRCLVNTMYKQSRLQYFIAWGSPSRELIKNLCLHQGQRWLCWLCQAQKGLVTWTQSFRNCSYGLQEHERLMLLGEKNVVVFLEDNSQFYPNILHMNSQGSFRRNRRLFLLQLTNLYFLDVIQ